jgi:AraC family ethanolamine operon transcriptional activator
MIRIKIGTSKINQSNNMSSNFFIKQTFTNFHEMAKTLKSWDIEIRQLEPSVINNTVTLLKAKNIYLSQFQFTGKTHQKGEFPPGRTFVFHWGEDSKILWRNKDVPLNSLMICPIGAKLDAVTKGTLASPHAISLPEELLLSRLQNKEQNLYMELVTAHDLIPVDLNKIKTLKDIFDKYIEGAEEDPKLIDSNVYQNCLEEELISALIDTLFTNESDNCPNTDTALSNIWEKLEKYIETHKNKPFRVSEVSQAVAVSESTLNRLFNAKFGISPKSYFIKLRLNAVYQDLKQSSPDKIKIYMIANKWGFWHMGQFAADYRKLFDELPFDTLNKSHS